MRRAVVSYDVDATDAEKELQLLFGLDEVISELLIEHDADASTLEDRCMDAIANAMYDKVAEE